ncbi:MAG: CoA-binding protein [Desulfobacterales bacterium]|nr:CoA-binding protein [Desulfobacterales bacterium]
MQTFFNPRSVAVVGASAKNLGNHVVLNLKAGFKGPIYPVNPNYPEIEGLPCYPSIDAIPGPLDLAIVIARAPAFPRPGPRVAPSRRAATKSPARPASASGAPTVWASSMCANSTSSLSCTPTSARKGCWPAASRSSFRVA